jgi:hypothetical protein
MGTDEHRFGQRNNVDAAKVHPAIAKRREAFNPFYVALLVLGIAFTVTASAYTVMIVRATKVTSGATEDGGLMQLLHARGMEIMGVEVLLLGVATVGAIGLDQWRTRRLLRSKGPEGNSPGREAGG